MTLQDLDALLTAPKRLGAMAMLDAAKRVEFSFLREQLEITDSDLSKQMAALGDAGYVSIRKTGHGRGSTTWYSITKTGRVAFRRHVAGLETLLHRPPVAPETRGTP